MDFSIKKLHFKLYKFVLSRPYPFDHWLLLVKLYIQLWFYSIFYSSIFCLILETTFIEFMKIYFVVNFFLMIFYVFRYYKFEFFKLVYHTVDQLFRMTIGRLFGLKPIDYNYKPFDQRKYYGKNVLDFDNERSSVQTQYLLHGWAVSHGLIMRRNFWKLSNLDTIITKRAGDQCKIGLAH